MILRTSMTLVWLGTLAVSAGAQSTNWSPKAPPRAYTAHVQMHEVPLREARQERNELHAYEMPTDAAHKKGFRPLDNPLFQQPTEMPQAVARSNRKEDARKNEMLPKEKSGVRALLADDELDPRKKTSPWEGLDGREMSRRMAEREWRIAHPGETPERDVAKTDSERADAQDAADEDSFRSWRNDGAYDRNGPRADVATKAEVVTRDENPADRFGRIAQDFVGGGAGADFGGLRPSDFEEVARRFEALQKSPALAARTPEPVQTTPAALQRNEAAGFSSAWGDAGFRGLREGAMMSGAAEVQPAAGFGAFGGAAPMAGFALKPSSGSVFEQPLEATRGTPMGSGGGEFKKPSALPW